MSRALLPLLFVLACTCAPIVPTPPEPVTPPTPPAPASVDAGVQPSPPEPATCESACEHQRSLPCELGDPTPHGTTCEQVCEHTQSGPIASLRWDLECLTHATACGQCGGKEAQ